MIRGLLWFGVVLISLIDWLQQPSSSGEAPVEEDGSEEVVTSSSKRFTLKLAKTNTVEAVTASPVEVRRDEPTGIVDEIVDTKVNDGTTTIHETKVYGTYIGDQYARVLESSSTILPVIVPSKAPSLAALKPKLAKPQLVIAEKITTPKPEPSTEATSESSHELRTQKSVSSSSDDVPQDEGGYTDEQLDNDSDDTYIESSSSVVVEPTPSASEEQTLYILPQKDDKAELYVSPVPNNNAYSRQPQIAVEVSPAKSFDFIVTATPSRKQFRQTTGKSNRFTNRFNNRGTSSSTESNELASSSSGSVETPAEDSGRRGTNRFRSRNRGRQNSEPEVLPTVSVYSKTVSASPGRRFTTSSRGRSFGKYTSEKPHQEQSYKTARSFGASSVSRYIEPTSSTSIYRFKLNRPTGRWRFKPSPKPKVNIIKTKDDDELTTQASGNIQQATAPLPQQANAPVYYQNLGESGDIQNLEESKTESNELAQDIEPELVPQTVRVATITPTEFDGLDKYLEIATIRSPYVFQAGNVKNTRYITLTKTFTKEHIQPTLASVAEATLENILATKPPYEKILEGSSDVATLPVIALGGDQMTPPLETVTQSFSTTQLMLKTSILPVLYDGVTTLYTLTQSYFVTRLVTAHKTVPPVELFQFVPTKSLTEFNTALQEAGSENREHLLASETEENDANYEHILAPPDELTSVGSDFDPSAMDEKIPKPGSSAGSPAKGKNLAATPGLKAKAEGSAAVPSDLAGLSPEQLAFLRYFNQAPGTGNNFFPPPLLPSQPQFQLTSSPIIVDTSTTIVESKTLRILFGAKATQTTLFSTRVVPTKMTTYVTTSVPVQATAAIPNFFQQAPFPLGYIG